MKKHHQVLLELLELREKDYDLFVDKLYDAITNEFSKYFKEELIKDKDHQQTLKIMIEHYEKKEEYEKCDVLLHLLNIG
jgi:hypothetical protein